MEPQKETILEVVKKTFLNQNPNTQFFERGLGQNDVDIIELCKQEMRQSHSFHLDVKRSQLFYDEIVGRGQIHDAQRGDFTLPFDSCLIGFEKPLMIRWRDGLASKDYVQKPLLAFLIFPVKKKTQETIQREGMKYPLTTEHAHYRAVLFFKEDATAIKKAQSKKKVILDDDAVVIGQQYINFGTYRIIGGTDDAIMVTHSRHYPCTNPLLCNIDESGMEKQTSKRAWVCDEIVCRDALFELIQRITNKIHESHGTVIKRKKGLWKFAQRITGILPSLPYGFPFTRGNLPKDNYVQYLDGKRYVYDKEDIHTGSGIQHRYKYDVRRHPRIVNTRIVWVEPHTRGKGQYIPKVYANRKRWSVMYLLPIAEQLTKVRIFELLMIRIIKFFKK